MTVQELGNGSGRPAVAASLPDVRDGTALARGVPQAARSVAQMAGTTGKDYFEIMRSNFRALQAGRGCS